MDATGVALSLGSLNHRQGKELESFMPAQEPLCVIVNRCHVQPV